MNEGNDLRIFRTNPGAPSDKLWFTLSTEYGDLTFAVDEMNFAEAFMEIASGESGAMHLSVYPQIEHVLPGNRPRDVNKLLDGPI